MGKERTAYSSSLSLVSNRSGEALGDGGRRGGSARKPEPPPLPGESAKTMTPREVMIDGRRYRLVPAEVDIDEGPAPEAAASATPLTAREVQIARLVAGGLVNKQIAVELRISEWTVATHLRRIFAKLGVETRAAMVARCFGGIVEP
jgi:DNA-binding CsgD family transcriptional regulator